MQTYESLIQSWNLISPSVVSAVKFGKILPSCTILMSQNIQALQETITKVKTTALADSG